MRSDSEPDASYWDFGEVHRISTFANKDNNLHPGIDSWIARATCKERYEYVIVVLSGCVSDLLMLRKVEHPKVVLLIWDWPQPHLAKHYGFDGDHVRKWITELSRKTYCTVVMTEPAKSEINLQNVIVQPPFRAKVKEETINTVINPRSYVLAGNIYAKQAFLGFAWTLAILRKFDYRTPALVHCGPVSKKLRLITPGVSWKGIIDRESVQDLIRSSGATYVPYPFSRQFSYVNRFAFPTKVVESLSCERPVFFHGASNSYSGEIVEQLKIGVHCDRIFGPKVARCIRRMNNALRIKWTRNILESWDSLFSAEQFKRKLRELEKAMD